MTWISNTGGPSSSAAAGFIWTKYGTPLFTIVLDDKVYESASPFGMATSVTVSPLLRIDNGVTVGWNCIMPKNDYVKNIIYCIKMIWNLDLLIQSLGTVIKHFLLTVCLSVPSIKTVEFVIRQDFKKFIFWLVEFINLEFEFFNTFHS